MIDYKEKANEHGKHCVLDDRPLTNEEREKIIDAIPIEQKKEWKKEIEEYKKKENL